MLPHLPNHVPSVCVVFSLWAVRALTQSDFYYYYYYADLAALAQGSCYLLFAFCFFATHEPEAERDILWRSVSGGR